MNNVEFIENKGQWDNNIAYQAKIPAGHLYLEQNELTYQFYDEQDMARLHELHHNSIQTPKLQDYLLNLHAFKVKFLGATTAQINASKPTSDYVNYFIGKDQSKWASNVKKYGEVVYKNLYHNVNLKFYLNENHLKYDFVVSPGGNAAQIQWEYDGVDNVTIENGKLMISTSVNQIIEEKPYAYQLIKGKHKVVKSRFKIEDGVVSIEFPRGYNKTYELIIDPTLIFASYTGSTMDNWGYTSTFDEVGNLYGGGVTFGVGYPTTTGAFQINFNGGNGNYRAGSDISISKFSPDGTSLIYATYLGGSFNESPHSLIVDQNNDLLILGTTASNDFPTTTSGYDTTFNGGASYTSVIPYYIGGSDIVVSKLSTDGSTLLGSTFMGGSSNDGLNPSMSLKHNYADDFRGEIMVDNIGDVYVASSTLSADFPTTPGAFQAIIGGGQDGCVFKLSSDLSSLIWSSFIGGSLDDAAYSIQFDSKETPHITGGTASNDFPTTAGVIQPSFMGGVDGFVTKINTTATNILSSTYLGTDSTEYDQCYFVQLDNADNVFVVGQTEGTYPITPSTVYNVPNSGQFIHKLTPNLDSTIFSTTFGTGSGEVDIALSAFLVNECNYILISGWGGAVNVWHGGAPFSTTNGLPVTLNAIQSTTDGSDYYLTMFGEDASDLIFATFFGGNSSDDHVDGGTSRFDKKGIVYQAVCASCYAATNDFPTTPGAWSRTDNSPNCNLGVFKIDLTRLTADVEAAPAYCLGDTVVFQNLSNGGLSYFWDFDDGSTSTDFEPHHVFDSVGTYSVMLEALDSISCAKRDTDYVDIIIGGPPTAIIDSSYGVCRGDSIQLSISGGRSYVWSPNYNISNDSVPNPTLWPDTTTMYTVITYDSCGTDTSLVTIEVFHKNIDVMPDTMICLGQSVQLYTSVGTNYLWSPSSSLNNPTIRTPMATPTTNTVYTVEITDTNGCVWDTSMTVMVDDNFPIAKASPDASICLGDSITIYASGGTQYSWEPSSSLNTPYDSVTVASPTQTTNYIVEAANGCGGDYDTTRITVNIVNATINDTSVCAGDRANLRVEGGISYLWSPGNEITNNIQPIINDTITFSVLVTDSIGCKTTLETTINTIEKPYVELGADIKTEWGNVVRLNATTNGINYWWSPADGLSCTRCLNPTVNSKEKRTYTLRVQGDNGCFNYDIITIIYDGIIFLPNVFTPDGDGINDIFYAIGVDIVKLDLYIFDRWGEQLFYTNDINVGWDGTYQGRLAETETYVWKVWYEDVLGKRGTLYGTVTLLK